MTSPLLTRCRRSAFTLIEVLATLVLLAIVLPVAMRGVSIALGAASSAKHTAEATTLAESKLNELVADGSWLTSGQGGDFAPDKPDYRWECVTESHDYGLSQVAVRVVWKERGQDRDLIVCTLASDALATGTSTEETSTEATP